MPKIKHKIFEIPIANNGNQSIDGPSLNAINKFLENPSFTYINHSIAISKRTELRNPFLDSIKDKELDIGTHRNSYNSPNQLNAAKNPVYFRHSTFDDCIILSLVYNEFSKEELGIYSDITSQKGKVKITGSKELAKLKFGKIDLQKANIPTTDKKAE